MDTLRLASENELRLAAEGSHPATGKDLQVRVYGVADVVGVDSFRDSPNQTTIGLRLQGRRQDVSMVLSGSCRGSAVVQE